MDWDQLDLNPRVVAAIKKAKIKSARDVLKFSGPDLQRLTKLSNNDMHHLLVVVSMALRNSSVVTVFQMYHEKAMFPDQHHRVSLGCTVLDRLLRGGLPLMGITELGGESAAGKTQISIQLCLSVQYPYSHGGLESGAVYICTEDAFPNKRLQQLIGLQHKLRTDVPPEVTEKITFGDNIFIEHAADIDTLNNCITKRVPILLLRGLVRLIVIDSIAALFRCEFAAKDSIIKAKHLQTLAAQLLSLSSRFMTPVFCVNQVTDAVGDASTGQSNTGKTDWRWTWHPGRRHMEEKEATSLVLDKKVSPALGITWSNQLIMRLMVTRTRAAELEQHPGNISQSHSGVVRTLEVVFAPHLPQSFCYYTINVEGVRGVAEKQELC